MDQTVSKAMNDLGQVSKFFCQTRFQIQKELGSEKNWVQLFWVWKNVSPNKFEPTKIESERNIGLNFFVSEIFLGLKKFGSQSIWVWKKCGSQKIFVSKKFEF